MIKVLLKILDAREIPVDDASLRAIERCKCMSVLDRWMDQALVATRIEDILKPSWPAVELAEGEEEDFAEGFIEGVLLGEEQLYAEILLKALAIRGLQVDDTSRQLIENCQSVLKLQRWLERAVVATRLEDVLDGPAQ